MTTSLLLKIRRGLKPAILCLLLCLLLLPAGCRQSQVSPAQTQASPQAQVRTTAAGMRADVGFATRQKFLDHYDKHGAEFGGIGKEEYLRQAQELRDRPASKDVLEIRRADGVVTRFDRKTGAFLAFNPDLTIRTFFKPNDGESYFHRQSKRPAK